MGFFTDFLDPLGLSETQTTDPSVQQVKTLSPEQQNTLSQLNLQGQQFLGQPGAQQGNLSQELQGLTPDILNQSLGSFQQGLGGSIDPLTAQGIQQGSQPFMDSLMQQFQGQVVPQIANQFGALDSARSSGLGQAIGRQASGIPFQAQQMFAQMMGQNNQQQLAQQGLNQQGGLAGLQFGGQQAFGQDSFNQLQRQEQFNRTSLGLGTPAFGNIGFPGTQTPSLFSQAAPAIGSALAAGI